ncbi:hypothetical protein C5167_036436 [Papaver somniferum]|uniref:Exostosin GT47 domain-containing protein n=2 Tax=Papaver somniferum TaxID=3469 RepID=A0A4Y7I5Y5_PAPSO|nr:hypothetical protein C5167_036436 [Papaver somniferum]
MKKQVMQLSASSSHSAPCKSSSPLLLLLVFVPLILVSLIVVCTPNSVSSSTTTPSNHLFSLASQRWSTWDNTKTNHIDSTDTANSNKSGTNDGEAILLPVSDMNEDDHEQQALFNSSTSFIKPSGSSTANSQQLHATDLTPSTVVGNEDYTPSTKYEHRYTKLEKIEVGLARARSLIKGASRNRSTTENGRDYVPQGAIYKNVYSFHRSYIEMEKKFKIFVYEGELPIFHDGPCKSIYSTEGLFIHQMEMNNHFRTKDPDEAHVFFLPFSVVRMVQYLYVPDSHEIKSIGRTVVDYVDVVARKYPYWNRSKGGDHFMLSCHDWGPRTSSFVPELFNNSIRVLCNANTSEGFNPSKDASFPEIHLRTAYATAQLGGLSPSGRSVLAFFAGGLHGHIRYLLLNQWKNKDQDVLVYDRVPKGVSYDNMMKTSKYCLCPSGYEVASPRIVEAIYAECVPVLISDHYVPPFSDVLNWKSFSVQISVSDIPNIKIILMGISQSQYIRMQRRVKQVQKHFVVTNDSLKRFDVFHMTLHSIWLRRLNFRIAGI